MSQQEPVAPNIISSTTLQRNIGQIMRRVHQGEHIIVERDGFSMMAILPIADYEQLKQAHNDKSV